MGVINPPSPVLFGPNNKAINLEIGTIQSDGSYNQFNGAKNYVTYGNFANGLATGWSAVGVAALTNGLPTSVGTGAAAFSAANGGRAAGANTTAPAVTSTGALTNGFSLNLATSGAGTIGDGYISQAYAVDAEDLGKVLNISLTYKVITGSPNMSGTVANTYAVAIYDLFNNTWIYPAGAFNFIQATGAGSLTAVFQTPINMTSFQLFIYSPVAPAAASSLLINSIVVGPQKTVNGPAMTDWVAYTPTINGFGTPTNVGFYSRRIGDSIQVIGNFNAGTAAATQAQITIGYNGANGNVVIDTTKILGGAQVVGAAAQAFASTTYFGLYPLGGNAVNYITLGVQSSTNSGTTAVNASVIGSGAFISLNFTVPIVGWSSNSSMSADTDTRVVAMQVTQASPIATLTSSFSLIKYTQTPVADTHGAFSTSTGLYTAPVTGYYRCTSSLLVAATYSAGNYTTMAIYKNGSITYQNQTTASGAAVQEAGFVSCTVFCNAGDTLAPYLAVAGTTATVVANANNNYFFAERLSGPAVVTATESVNARYYSSSTTVSGTLATVLYSTKGWDSHNAYNVSTGQYTAPVSGRYQVNASIAMTGTFVLNSTLDLQVQQTGSRTQTSESKSFSGGAVTQMNTNVGDIFWCNAGDIIQVQTSNSGTTPVIAATTTQNWISIARVGN